MESLSIVVPVYNEDLNLKNLTLEINQSLAQKYNYEIIFVNDGSTDNSINVIYELKKIFSNIKLINFKKNNGQSFCIYKGIENSKYDSIVTIDADLQNDPFDIPKLAKIYFDNYPQYQMIGGLRLKRKDSIVKILSSKLANNIRKLILNDKCDDTGCSLKIFDKNEFLKLTYFKSMHRFLPALFIALNNRNLFVNVNHRYRTYGISKYGTIDRLLRGIIDIFRVLIIIRNIKK